MTDQVFVSGLALHAYHGVMPHEAKVGQTFKLDLTLDIDLNSASRSDKLADTVGYDQVVNVASEAFRDKRYRLVEAAAGGAVRAARLLCVQGPDACGVQQLRRALLQRARRSRGPVPRRFRPAAPATAPRSPRCAGPGRRPPPGVGVHQCR